VVTAEVPSRAVFEQVADAGLDPRVRIWSLVGFCEELFGHVPMTEIDATWFAYVMHPKYRQSDSVRKRMIDLVLASVIGIVFLPLLALAALLIRLDGGEVFFRQRRIGQRGRPFTILKLRTMRAGAAADAQWSALDDPRVTRIGKVLRRTHLDELPQLLNVLRGEMSLVGPRPEVPVFVEYLEEALEFYSRRHMLKPGITGWAQVRCGYAGSDIGSAWKLCHDLYYLKHRSLALDLVILAETLAAPFVESHVPRVPAGPWISTMEVRSTTGGASDAALV
jgi:lipopolysaccharide/colanic/teichoic acid biosynthesis glycosyltransferase